MTDNWEDWDETFTIVEDEHLFEIWNQPKMFNRADFSKGEKPLNDFVQRWIQYRYQICKYPKYNDPDIEYWAPLPAYLQLSKYEISTHGNLRSLPHKKHMMNIMLVDEYIKNGLQHDNGKIKYHLRHRLVAFTFLNNPRNCRLVDHYYGVRYNNHVGILRWATDKENMANKTAPSQYNCRKIAQLSITGELIKVWNGAHRIMEAFNCSESVVLHVCNGRNKTGLGFKWEYYEPDLPGEIWKEHITETGPVRVSNLGRVRKYYGGLTLGTLIRDYFSVSVGGKSYRVHRLVCEAFHGSMPLDKPSVDHINVDHYDNRACNLRWADSSEQSLNQTKTGNRGKAIQRSVSVKNRRTGKVIVFPSIKTASLYTKRNSSMIYKYIRGESQHQTCDWHYTDGGVVHTYK